MLLDFYKIEVDTIITKERGSDLSDDMFKGPFLLC
jgi:hypothetical protein